MLYGAHARCCVTEFSKAHATTLRDTRSGAGRVFNSPDISGCGNVFYLGIALAATALPVASLHQISKNFLILKISHVKIVLKLRLTTVVLA
jgi:hypothetical protein